MFPGFEIQIRKTLVTQTETACNSVAKNPICPFRSGVLLPKNLADLSMHTRYNLVRSNVNQVRSSFVT